MFINFLWNKYDLSKDNLNSFSFVFPHPGADEVGTASNDVGIVTVLSPAGTVSSGTQTVKVVVRNYGNNSVTGNNPIFIVDDILSEHDQKHSDILMKNFWDNQTIITTIKDINLRTNKIYL